MATWQDVADVVAALPETHEGTAYGDRAWRIGTKLLVWERHLRKTELAALGPDAPTGDILALRTEDVAEKDALIAAAAHVFFTTPHFDGHAVVLARLPELPIDALTRLVEAAWLRLAPKRLVAAFADARTLHG